MYVNESQLDALREVINLGVGYAAGSLNELVGRPISLRVPEVDVMSLDDARCRIGALGWDRVASVQLAFAGALTGNVALLFPYESAVSLVTLLTEDGGGSSADVDGIKAATLEETGNIVLNGVVGSISNLLDGQISFSIPYYSEEPGLPVYLAGMGSAGAVKVIVARARFTVSEHPIEGEIFLFLELSALVHLMAALDHFLESTI